MMHETAKEYVEAWDRGDIVTTVERGGLGPGYEQCIQIMVVEFCRVGLSFERTDDEEIDAKKFERECTRHLRIISDRLGGPSDAQVYAATDLAWRYLFRGGPKRTIESAKKFGIYSIMCSKHFPSAP